MISFGLGALLRPRNPLSGFISWTDPGAGKGGFWAKSRASARAINITTTSGVKRTIRILLDTWVMADVPLPLRVVKATFTMRLPRTPSVWLIESPNTGCRSNSDWKGRHPRSGGGALFEPRVVVQQQHAVMPADGVRVEHQVTIGLASEN